jgi:hypothetical protein
LGIDKNAQLNKGRETKIRNGGPMTDLRSFLSEMALDPAKFAEFLRDPESAMRRERLSEEDRDALLSGIPAMIAARLASYLAFPPPYYTPSPVFVTSPPPNYVTMAPLYVVAPPPNYVTAPPPLYVTAPPPLYVTAASPQYVTMPPPLVMPPLPREGPHPAPPKTPPKKGSR